MNNYVVLDTSFLITFVNATEANHNVARSYYRYFLANEFTLLLPAIAIAEFEIKQPITTFPLQSVRILPFNFEDAKLTGSLHFEYYMSKFGKSQPRICIKDDFKIIAQAEVEKARFLLADDDMPYYKELKKDGKINVKMILLKNGFEESIITDSPQSSLGFS